MIECVVCDGRNRHERQNLAKESEYEILFVLSEALFSVERSAARRIGDRRMNE